MTRLQRALLGVVLLGAASAAASAQQQRPALFRLLFRGVAPTAEQRTQIQGIREQFATQAAPAQAARKADMVVLRAARQSGDTAAMHAARAEVAADVRRAQAARVVMLKAVRATLTTDQQALFDQNFARVRRVMRRNVLARRSAAPG